MEKDTKNQPEAGEEKKNPLSALSNIFQSRDAREAQDEVNKLSSALESASEEFDRVKSELEDANKKVQSLESKVDSLEADLKQRDGRITELQGEVEKAEASAGGKAAQIAAQSNVDVTDLPAQSGTEAEDLPANKKELSARLDELKSHEERSALLRKYNAAHKLN